MPVVREMAQSFIPAAMSPRTLSYSSEDRMPQCMAEHRQDPLRSQAVR